jgi:vacuolar protein sorting-associated protein 13D
MYQTLQHISPASHILLTFVTVITYNLFTHYIVISVNQETIAEIVGLTHRLFPQLKPGSQQSPQAVPVYFDTGTASSQDGAYATPQEDGGPSGDQSQGRVVTSTEFTFDFHRLNVHLLRAIMKDCGMVGRKIGTATMIEAKVQASVGKCLIGS